MHITCSSLFTHYNKWIVYIFHVVSLLINLTLIVETSRKENKIKEEVLSTYIKSF